MVLCVVLAVGPLPPTSTSCPPDVIHVINAPRLSLFFAGLPLPCIIVNAKPKDQNGIGLGLRLVIRGTGVTCRHTYTYSHAREKTDLHSVLAMKTRQAPTENNIQSISELEG